MNTEHQTVDVFIDGVKYVPTKNFVKPVVATPVWNEWPVVHDINSDWQTDKKVWLTHSISNESMCGIDLQTETIEIPKGVTISQSFTSQGESFNFSGSFVFYETPSSPAVPVDVWVSFKPGGPPVNNTALVYGQSERVEFKWMNKDLKEPICLLEPHTDYYLNIKHSNSMRAASNVYRTIKIIT
tara:strand:+ start:1063 stop:1614 length:552 start_codon:yes stop_codon:yes gene_type:complete